MSSASRTVDHEEIRKWAEERGGRPSIVRTGNEGGVLRLDFGPKEDSFEEVSWEDFFELFEESALAFLHQDETADGKQSRFSRFVRRTEEDGRPPKKAAAKKKTAGGEKTSKAGAAAKPKTATTGKPVPTKASTGKSETARAEKAKAAPKASRAKKPEPKKGAAGTSADKKPAAKKTAKSKS